MVLRMGPGAGGRYTPRVALLAFTPPDRLVDAQGRPYFLWDAELTLEEFRRGLRGPDPEARAYLVAKLMRQAKPDDVFQFVSLEEIGRLWPRLQLHLGRTAPMWSWLLQRWGALGRGDG